ncbi:MAG TPA: hypothetical protein G4O00_07340 [Thermoflexia bacterium]|jgi:hypothetical protein|nr:hypothetical protein [Thermoflexia bacterium]
MRVRHKRGEKGKRRQRIVVHVPADVADLVRVMARATGRTVAGMTDHLVEMAMRTALGNQGTK